MTASPDPEDFVEELVFACLEADDPDAELESIARRHPEHAERVGRIYRFLLERELAGGEVPDAPIAPDGELPGVHLVRRLGVGGMGTVYLAEQQRPLRRVAVKVAHSALLQVPGARERFRREVEVAASLQHPGIVQVYSVGEDGQRPHFTMEYVPGCTLADVLREFGDRDPVTVRGRDMEQLLEREALDEGSRGTQSRIFEEDWPGACIAIGRQIAEALAHAHSRGVLHRDVKPSNILIGRDGRVRLADFGLAWIEDGQDLTRSTSRLGSLPYLPPECLGERAPIPSAGLDVYALGVTLHELLALRHPFRGDGAEQTRRNILAARPEGLRAQNRAVRADLETVCLVAMDPDPTQRYRSVADLGVDLQRVAERRPITVRRPGPARRAWRWAQRHPTLSVSAAVAVLALSVSLVVFAWQQRASRKIAEALGARLQDRTERFDLLRHVPELQRLARQVDGLGPAWPASTARIRAWLDDGWQPFADAVPRIRAAIARLAAGAPSRAGVGPGDDSGADGFLHDALTRLVTDADAFESGAVQQLRDDLTWSERIGQLTVDHPAARRTWSDVARELRAAAGTDSPYADAGPVGIAPQIGLVPIGVNPVTGLWEFYHLRSAADPTVVPAQDPVTGHVQVDEGTGIVFVLVPGGTFDWGAQSDDPNGPNHDPHARAIESPPRRFTVDRYFIARHELSQAQWMRLSGGPNPSYYRGGPGRPMASFDPPTTHPVESVDWYRSRDLMRRHGLDLPTECQWEYACRGGTATPWWTGADREELRGAANLADQTVIRAGATMPGAMEWPEFDDGHLLHAPVDALRANPFGLHHVHGNVWEWCLDAIARHTSPAAPGTGLRDAGKADAARVQRGGSCADGVSACRSAYRNPAPATFHNGYTGLRPARAVL